MESKKEEVSSKKSRKSSEGTGEKRERSHQLSAKVPAEGERHSSAKGTGEAKAVQASKSKGAPETETGKKSQAAASHPDLLTFTKADRIRTPHSSQPATPPQSTKAEAGGSSGKAASTSKSREHLAPGVRASAHVEVAADVPTAVPTAASSSTYDPRVVKKKGFTLALCSLIFVTFLLMSALAFSVWVLFQTTDYMVERKEREFERASSADWRLVRKLMLWGALFATGALVLARLLALQSEREDNMGMARYAWLLVILLLPLARIVWYKALAQVKERLFGPVTVTMDRRARMNKFVAYFAIALAGAALAKLWANFVSGPTEDPQTNRQA